MSGDMPERRLRVRHHSQPAATSPSAIGKCTNSGCSRPTARPTSGPSSARSSAIWSGADDSGDENIAPQSTALGGTLRKRKTPGCFRHNPASRPRWIDAAQAPPRPLPRSLVGGPRDTEPSPTCRAPRGRDKGPREQRRPSSDRRTDTSAPLSLSFGCPAGPPALRTKPYFTQTPALGSGAKTT